MAEEAFSEEAIDNSLDKISSGELQPLPDYVTQQTSKAPLGRNVDQGALPPNVQRIVDDPRIMTRMVNTDGTTFKALPSDVDAFIQQGARVFNPDSSWEVKQNPFSEVGRTVKASELPDLLKQGYSTNKMQKYQAEQAQLQEFIDAERAKAGNLTPTEYTLGALSALSSSATMGLTDILGRGANEIIGSLKGDDNYGEEAGKQLLSLRDNLGAVGITADVLGGILSGVATGGLAPGIGKGVLSGAARMAAEGAAMSAGSSLGRKALGDEDVNAQTFLWDVGLGAGVGGVLGLVTHSLSSAISGARKAGQQTMSIVDVNLDPNFNTRSFALDANPTRSVVPVFDSSNKMIGEVTLSRNQAGYHLGDKSTGVTLEAAKFVDDAPKDAIYNTMRELTTQFGSVSSPSSLADLDPLRQAFNIAGVKKRSSMGDPWFTVTESTLPKAVQDENTSVLALTKKYYELTGKAPDDATKESFEKLFDPKTGAFRKEYLDFKADPGKYLATTMDDFKNVNKVVKEQIRAAESAREEIGKLITPQGGLELRKEIASFRTQIEGVIQNNVKPIPVEQARLVEHHLTDVMNSLDKMVANQNTEEVYRFLRIKKQELGETVRYYKKNGVVPELGSALDDTYKGFKGILESDKVIGQWGSSLSDLERKSAQALESSKAFLKEFGKVDAKGNRVVSSSKVAQAYRAFREGTVLDRLSVLDTFMADSHAFGKAVESLKESGLIQQVKVPDLNKITPYLENINKYRSFTQTSKMLEQMKANSPISGAIQRTAAMGGSLAGYAAGGPIGSSIGATLLQSYPVALSDPTAMLKFASKSSRGVDKVLSLASYLLRATPAVAGAANKVSARIGIENKLGLPPKLGNKEYIEAARSRIRELSDPLVLEQLKGQLGHEPQEEAVKKSLETAYKYALDHIPTTSTYANISNAQVEKMNKVIYAMVSPQAALHKAIKDNDTEIINHLQTMYPKAFALYQAHVSANMDPKAMSFQQKVKVQKVTGLPIAGVSKRAFSAGRSVFSGGEQTAPTQGSKKVNTKNITAPQMTVGESVQQK